MYQAAPPSVWEVTWQLLVCLLGTEVLFFSLHWFMHRVQMYKNYHKLHHEFKTPVGVASEYASAVEDMVVNFPSTFLTPVLMGVHPVVLFLWLMLRIWETVDVSIYMCW